MNMIKKLLVFALVMGLFMTPANAQFSLKKMVKDAVSTTTGDKSSSKKSVESKKVESAKATVESTTEKAVSAPTSAVPLIMDEFYEACRNDLMSIKDRWPSVENWKGEKELKPSYEVDKPTKMKFAEEFLKTTLCTRAFQQSQMIVGKMHQSDNKIIKSRVIGSASFNLYFHGDEYIVSLSKDYKTKKWVMDFSYNHGQYSQVPKGDHISINIDGSQLLEGSKSSSAYCVIADIGLENTSGRFVGLDVRDSSAERGRKSDKCSDLGIASSWDR